MIPKAKSYNEGTWFGVPLRNGGYARGLIARAGNGGILFGYFFGPKLNSLPREVPSGLKPEDRVLWGKFGHLGFVKERWPLIGNDPNWNKEQWPMPTLVRVDEISGVAFQSKYDDDTMKLISEERCDPELAKSHPYDSLMGAGSVEIRLTKLLGGLSE